MSFFLFNVMMFRLKAESTGRQLASYICMSQVVVASVFKTPRVNCDLCLTNLDFGLSLSILRVNESCSQHAKKRNF